MAANKKNKRAAPRRYLKAHQVQIVSAPTDHKPSLSGGTISIAVAVAMVGIVVWGRSSTPDLGNAKSQNINQVGNHTENSSCKDHCTVINYNLAPQSIRVDPNQATTNTNASSTVSQTQPVNLNLPGLTPVTK